MKTLNKLGPALALVMIFTSHAFGAPIPCGPPEPGQTSTPPCETQVALGGVNTPDGASLAPIDMGKPARPNETSFTQIAADVLLNFLPLF
jgi:hypothetical protein